MSKEGITPDFDEPAGGVFAGSGKIKILRIIFKKNVPEGESY